MNQNVWKTRPLHCDDFIGSWVHELTIDIAAVNALEHVYGGVTVIFDDPCPGQNGVQCCGAYDLCRSALNAR